MMNDLYLIECYPMVYADVGYKFLLERVDDCHLASGFGFLKYCDHAKKSSNAEQCSLTQMTHILNC